MARILAHPNPQIMSQVPVAVNMISFKARVYSSWSRIPSVAIGGRPKARQSGPSHPKLVRYTWGGSKSIDFEPLRDELWSARGFGLRKRRV